ncbi:hypothetical protein [Helicobacter sp. WB40]|uniref:hypothetical protein n=1 Tax=Helicobacter sp. WB40 TaxID=3004130 RepID=UPI0022EC16BC|nr:hypothetical protein [Helicobacter sp. WB40]MDA3967574.1 hypothetical protein [Helicobacter sp. WB40]
MRKKILIYGYGWSGFCAYEFLKNFDFDLYVVDDNLDFSVIGMLDCKFTTLKDISLDEIDLVFISTFHKEPTLKIRDKLISLFVDESKIKHFYNESYKNSVQYLLASCFPNTDSLFTELKESDFELEEIHIKIENIVKKHRELKLQRSMEAKKLRDKIDNTINNATIFSKILSLSKKSLDLSGTWINYPGFCVVKSNNKKHDDNFYFIEKIDFESVSQRDKDTKLIACFGNSALRVEYMDFSKSITGYMRESLGDSYIVLNFGVTGYTIYEQMMLYNALVYPLKPDITLSFFAGTDFRVSSVSDSMMVKRHKMIYTTGVYEYLYKKSVESKMPLWTEMGNLEDGINKEISYEDTINAIESRLRQFNAIVSAGGGAFYSFIQPLLPCKLKWTQEEQNMRKKEEEFFAKTAIYQNKIIQDTPKLIEYLKSKLYDCEFLYDLNEVTKDSLESIFTNYWIHCNELGNKMVAREVIEFLKNKGELC